MRPCPFCDAAPELDEKRFCVSCPTLDSHVVSVFGRDMEDAIQRWNAGPTAAPLAHSPAVAALVEAAMRFRDAQVALGASMVATDRHASDPRDLRRNAQEAHDDLMAATAALAAVKAEAGG